MVKTRNVKSKTGQANETKTKARTDAVFVQNKRSKRVGVYLTSPDSELRRCFEMSNPRENVFFLIISSWYFLISPSDFLLMSSFKTSPLIHFIYATSYNSQIMLEDRENYIWKIEQKYEEKKLEIMFNQLYEAKINLYELDATKIKGLLKLSSLTHAKLDERKKYLDEQSHTSPPPSLLSNFKPTTEDDVGQRSGFHARGHQQVWWVEAMD
ncbi:hypothetical protein RND71_042427 [Anisodus tanguticus]|uniref:Uncharacterized protein n=1 Tax=Anisodus tanguticus TaxID=243964 RepID=A0AAE1QQM3_9SOLA|nr:hypothetical protein RND71_042427 [Anisodus tanguticus]